MFEETVRGRAVGVRRAFGACSTSVRRAFGVRPASARSDRQTLAAFSAPGVDNGTAATRLHADKKTVRAGAADLRGLVSALHREFLWALRVRFWTLVDLAGPCSTLLKFSDSPQGQKLLRLLPRREFGKPMITSKNSLSVKHLHHSLPHPAGVDGSRECVDNCVPPVARDP